MRDVILAHPYRTAPTKRIARPEVRARLWRLRASVWSTRFVEDFNYFVTLVNYVGCFALLWFGVGPRLFAATCLALQISCVIACVIVRLAYIRMFPLAFAVRLPWAVFNAVVSVVFVAVTWNLCT